jgi:hypothetical protein
MESFGITFQPYTQQTKTLSPVRPANSLQAEAFKRYLDQEGKIYAYTLQEVGACLDLSCDEIYGMVDLYGYNNNTQSWDENTFWRNAGDLFGYYTYIDPYGDIVNSPIDAVDAIFTRKSEKDIHHTLLNTGSDLLKTGFIPIDVYARCLWTCLYRGIVPTEGYIDNVVRKRIQAYKEKQKRDQDDMDRAVQLNMVRVVTSATINMLHREYSQSKLLGYPPQYPFEYYYQNIVGDNACFYRSIANNLIYRITGYNFGQGVNFPTEVLKGNIDAWIDEYATVEFQSRNIDLLAILVNIVTKWVHFYIYLIMATDIPVNNVKFFEGVVGISDVRPITTIGELMTDNAIFERFGRSEANPGVYHVPSMDLVLRYVMWLFLAIANKSESVYSWNSIKPFFDLLLAVPYNIGPFQIAKTLPDKELRIFTPSGKLEGSVSLGSVLMSGDEYSRVIRAGGTTTEAYRVYVRAMLQMNRWGGQSEAVGFANLLYSADYLFKTVVIYEPYNWTTWWNTGYIVPTINEPIKMNIKPQITVLFTQSHYSSLLPYPGLEKLDRGQLIMYIYGPEEPEEPAVAARPIRLQYTKVVPRERPTPSVRRRTLPPKSITPLASQPRTPTRPLASRTYYPQEARRGLPAAQTLLDQIVEQKLVEGYEPEVLTSDLVKEEFVAEAKSRQIPPQIIEQVWKQHTTGF